MAKPNMEFYDCYIVAEELRDAMWSIRNAHETLTDPGAGFTLKQRGALYTILAMCDKLSNLADIIEEIGGRDNERPV